VPPQPNLPVSPTPGAPANRLRVVQCNILHGGWPYEVRGRTLFVERAGSFEAHEKNFTRLSYPPDDCQQGDPGTDFARLMQTVQPDVIGMQEVCSQDVGRLRELLGPEWRNTPPLDGNAASCIFWNSATVAALQPEEVAVIQTYVNPEGTAIRIRALKQVCLHTGSQKKFAVVTGKSWYQGSTHDRKLRAARTRNFARRGRLTTVIAIDMSPPRSPAFALMAPFVAKGSQKTCPAGIFEGRPGSRPMRTDHVFYYSPLLRGPQKSGIIGCGTGPFFGSDHLYVWADVKLP
jgi:Endonuclease/Exonuclease/phosphatase family